MQELTIREKALLEYVLANAANMLDDTMLSALADQECRLCLLELGIN